MTELHQLLADLIRIPSPNPPGDARRIASFIDRWLRSTDAAVHTVYPSEKTEAHSVVAVLGSGEPPVITLHAHIDTVPVGEAEAKEWSRAPYTPTVMDGRMYGKGSVDDKAPLAAMMIAFSKIAAASIFRGTLVLAAAAEEETGGQLGTKWLVDAGHLYSSDFIIVGEQTHNHVALAHKGVMRATITTRGRSVHATNPDRGINAIAAMSKIVLALNTYHKKLASRQHPLVGHPTCNVGTIKGGNTANAVPDSCVIRIDRRMIPGEDPEAVQDELKHVVGNVDIAPADVSVDDFLFSSWFESSLETDLGRAFLITVRSVTDSNTQPIGYLPGSDAKHLMKLARGDMVVFGPGSYEVAHAADEYVELAALDRCEAIITGFLRRTMLERG